MKNIFFILLLASFATLSFGKDASLLPPTGTVSIKIDGTTWSGSTLTERTKTPLFDLTFSFAVKPDTAIFYQAFKLVSTDTQDTVRIFVKQIVVNNYKKLTLIPEKELKSGNSYNFSIDKTKIIDSVGTAFDLANNYTVQFSVRDLGKMIATNIFTQDFNGVDEYAAPNVVLGSQTGTTVSLASEKPTSTFSILNVYNRDTTALSNSLYSTTANSIFFQRPATYLVKYRVTNSSVADTLYQHIQVTSNVPDTTLRVTLKTINPAWFTNDMLNPANASMLSRDSLNFNGFGVKNMTGINFFTGLRKLYCSNNTIFKLPVQNLTQLRELVFANNFVDTLFVGNLTNLKILDCSINQFSNLDVSALTNLEMLNCGGNFLKTLTVQNLPLLKNLYCNGNAINSLTISNLTTIESINIANNKLTTFNTSAFSSLTSFIADANLLTSVTFSNFNLQTISLADNLLANVSLSGVQNLRNLNISGNLLTTLTTTNISNIIVLDCHKNLLTSLNLTANPSLYTLDCSDNAITNITGFPLSLKEIDVSKNQLSTLNLAGYDPVSLFIHNNPLTNFTPPNQQGGGGGSTTTIAIGQFTFLSIPKGLACSATIRNLRTARQFLMISVYDGDNLIFSGFPDVSLSGNSSALNYSTFGTITASQTILDGNKVNYRAEKSILLKPGFSVNANATTTFLGIIGACNL